MTQYGTKVNTYANVTVKSMNVVLPVWYVRPYRQASLGRVWEDMNDAWRETLFGFNNMFLGDFLASANPTCRTLHSGMLADRLRCSELIKLFCTSFILDNVRQEFSCLIPLTLAGKESTDLFILYLLFFRVLYDFSLEKLSCLTNLAQNLLPFPAFNGMMSSSILVVLEYEQRLGLRLKVITVLQLRFGLRLPNCRLRYILIPIMAYSTINIMSIITFEHKRYIAYTKG